MKITFNRIRKRENMWDEKMFIIDADVPSFDYLLPVFIRAVREYCESPTDKRLADVRYQGKLLTRSWRKWTKSVPGTSTVELSITMMIDALED